MCMYDWTQVYVYKGVDLPSEPHSSGFVGSRPWLHAGEFDPVLGVGCAHVAASTAAAALLFGIPAVKAEDGPRIREWSSSKRSFRVVRCRI